MFKNLHIIIAALLVNQAMVAAQTSAPTLSEPVEVCAGRRSEITVTGSDGSWFQYDMPKDAGRKISENNDTLIWEWASTRGKTYRIGVREVNPLRCLDVWGYQEIKIVGAELRLDHDQYMLCEGEEVQVSFNDGDFKATSWSDPSIKNNTITRPGTYTLKAFDQYNCLISKEVTVLGGPKADLGRDTLICSPDFRIYVLNNEQNDQETVYTWSTGEHGYMPYIDFHRDDDHDVFFWVRAEWNGCSVADTMVVMSCAIPELRIPNTFTPNGDGTNDAWHIPSLINYPNVVVEIYDRWGRRVYVSKKGYPIPWDGRDANGNNLPLETYYYIIDLHDGVHGHPLLGNVTIVR